MTADSSLRQAFITVTLAIRGNVMHFVVAPFQMDYVHTDKIQDKSSRARGISCSIRLLGILDVVGGQHHGFVARDANVVQVAADGEFADGVLVGLESDAFVAGELLLECHKFCPDFVTEVARWWN